MACVVILSLMRTLELEFLQLLPRPILQQKELIPCNKELAQSLHKKLGFLMELFDENRMDGVEAIKDLETKLRNVAFRIEDEIELQVVHLYEEEEEEGEEDDAFNVEMPVGNTSHCQRLHQILHPLTGNSHPCLKFRFILHRAIQDIDAIEEELVKVKMEYNHFIALQGRKTTLDAVTPKYGSSKHVSHSEDVIMVGKTNEFKTIREMLIQHPSKQREVVSIIGMGGIGKTTLARRIYEDPSITSHFDERAWVVVSQHHNKRQMLEGILNSIGNSRSGSDEDLALRLYQCLKGLRYLVVMDDVWSGEAWDAIKACFPDDINGSRVLLTTRLKEVANNTCTKDDFSHQMQLLEQSESWKLFSENACKSHGAEFETIGRPIVEKCRGLPLAIKVVAGLFSKLNTLDEWKNTANALCSSATTLDDEECSRILSLSYNHLPYNLKACFLYLGVFSEDYEINANHLARLWFAEGLVKPFENESFDAVANRSFFCFLRMDSSFDFKNFNLLRVLYSSTEVARLKKIEDIVHLRVLICRYNNIELFRVREFLKSKCSKNIEVFRAWNLQTLHCYRVSYRSYDGGNYSEFPQLHYIHCGDYFHGNPPNFARKLSWIRADDCSKEYIMNIPYLKKVRIGGKGRDSNACITNLAYLEQLEGLHISFSDETQMPINHHIVLLKNLRKLSLYDMRFEWEEINILSKLPRLEVLKLTPMFCSCKKWEIQEEVIFRQLIILYIFSSDFKHWKASSHNFPKLEHIFLWNCGQLREIPIAFAEISTLSSIKLAGCLPSAVNSAKKIQDEQRDYGNYDMVVSEKHTRVWEENLSEEDPEVDK